MNLNKITKALLPATFVFLASCSTTAATTDERIIEFNSKDTQTHITQTHNDETDEKQAKIKVHHDGEDHEFSFNEQQLKDDAFIDNTLSPLPDDVRKKIARLLKKMEHKGQLKIVLDGDSEWRSMTHLSPEKNAKLEKKLKALEAVLEKKLAKIEANAEKMEKKAKAIELRVSKEMEALDLDEFEIEMDEINEKIHEVTMHLDDIDFADINLSGLNTLDKEIIVIQRDDIKSPEINTQAIIKMINKGKLTQEQKQAIRDALN